MYVIQPVQLNVHLQHKQHRSMVITDDPMMDDRRREQPLETPEYYYVVVRVYESYELYTQ